MNTCLVLIFFSTPMYSVYCKNKGIGFAVPILLEGAVLHSPVSITGAGELTTATLYPYWKDEPKAETSVAKARTRVNLCRANRKSGVGYSYVCRFFFPPFSLTNWLNTSTLVHS